MRNTDLTQGNTWKLLVMFAIPLFFSNLLQQLYNAMDAMVVGRFVGDTALAAVGSVGPLINTIIAFFMGMSTGASVLISRYYGARDPKGLHDTLHTAMLLAAIIGVVLGTIGVVLTPALLGLMKTPLEVAPEATIYLRIFFIGMPTLTIYNMGAAALTAVGDAKRPLFFLAIATVINIIGNLLLVLVIPLGVAGVSISTVASQLITAVLVVIVLSRSNAEYRLIFRNLGLRANILKQVASIGLPSGLQLAIVGLSNIIVQSYVNGLGKTAMAGAGASGRVEAFVLLPVQAMALALATFVGQNLGAGQVRRARNGVRSAMIITMAITAVISLLAVTFGKSLLRIFTASPEVVELGYQFMRVYVPAYVVLAFTSVLPGALRGAGDVRVATVASVFCFVVVRQIYLFFITKAHYTITAVALGFPSTWVLAGGIIFIHYLRTNWSAFEKKPDGEQPLPVLEDVSQELL